MIRKMWNARRATAGESLVESLTALLVVVLAVTGLAVAVTAASRVNATLQNGQTELNLTGAESKTISVTFTNGSRETTHNNLTRYKTTNGYYYYE